MTDAKIPHWLERLHNTMRVHPSFMAAMNTELSRQFTTLTHYNLEKDFILMNHIPNSFRILDDNEGNYMLEGDLVGRRMGYAVQIRWKVVGEKRLWHPVHDITDINMEFWWENLPVAEILEEEKKSDMPLYAPAAFNFMIETKIGVWPHLCLLFTCKEAITQNTLNEYLALFVKIQEEWNTNEKNPGFIHSIGEIKPIDEQSFQVNIDFGSACKAGLDFVLKKTEEKNTISKVKIYS